MELFHICLIKNYYYYHVHFSCIVVRIHADPDPQHSFLSQKSMFGVRIWALYNTTYCIFHGLFDYFLI